MTSKANASPTFKCWDGDNCEEDDAVSVTGRDAYDAADAAQKYVEDRWSRHYATEGVDRIDVMVRDESGALSIVDVTVDWEPVFHARERK